MKEDFSCLCLFFYLYLYFYTYEASDILKHLNVDMLDFKPIN